MGSRGGQIGNLPTDVLLQVFSRLPPITICECMYVSKQWHDLIADQSFLNLLSVQLKTKPLLLGVKAKYASRCATIRLIVPSTNFSIEKEFVATFDESILEVAYCSGLLLLTGFTNYHVYNPSTQQCAKVESLGSRDFSLCIGFGYLPSTSQHKIINFSNWSRNIFASKALVVTLPNGCMKGSLKSLEVNSLSFKECYPCDEGVRPICVSGILYWMIRYFKSWEKVNESREILTFDLGLEEFQVIVCPLRYSISSLSILLAELKGRPCVVHMLRNGPVCLDVWALEDKKSEMWTKAYTIDSTFVGGGYLSELFMLWINIDDDGEEKILMTSRDGNFYNYSLKTNTYKTLAGQADNFSWFILDHVSVLPNFPNKREEKKTEKDMLER